MINIIYYFMSLYIVCVYETLSGLVFYYFQPRLCFAFIGLSVSRITQRVADEF